MVDKRSHYWRVLVKQCMLEYENLPFKINVISIQFNIRVEFKSAHMRSHTCVSTHISTQFEYWDLYGKWVLEKVSVSALGNRKEEKYGEILKNTNWKRGCYKSHILRG